MGSGTTDALRRQHLEDGFHQIELLRLKRKLQVTEVVEEASAAAIAADVKVAVRAEEELQAVDLNTAVNLRKASGISHTVDLRRRVYRRMAADPTEEERRKRIRDQREEV